MSTIERDRTGDGSDVSTPPASAGAAPSSGTTFETLAVCGFVFGLFAIVAAVFAVGLAARAVGVANDSGSDTPAAVAGGGGSTLDVTLVDFAFEPAELQVAAGSVLRLTNDGTVAHNLAVDGVASDMVDPGSSGDLDLGALDPGSYTMICEVAGHAAAGMTGTLVIE